MHETYDAVSEWPLDHVLAANDLLDAIAEAEADARDARESD